MKRLSASLLLVLFCQVLLAESISRETAQRQAAAVLGQDARLELAAVGRGSEPAYYVFNNTSSRGFVIVAGDGEASGDNILGYSSASTFDRNTMPPQMAYMLQCYEEQVEMVRQGKAAVHRAAERDEVAPLIATTWDQMEPYNAMNPDGCSEYPAGCVATAMAQILRYHAYDHEVKAIDGYNMNGHGKRVNGLPATTFNYGILRDSYYANETDESAQEVAKLTAYCGRSVEMVYSPNGSSAPVSGYAFQYYFGYSSNYEDEDRSRYTAEAWDELIYQEVKAGRPVLYSGNKATDSGHAFIVDGYKDGFFHINWGWGGYRDNYFKLSACNPYSAAGAGAGTGLDGYSFDQSALTRLAPQVDKKTDPTPPNVESSKQLEVLGEPAHGNLKAKLTVPLTFTIKNNGQGNYHTAYLYVDGTLMTGAGVYADANGGTAEVEMVCQFETAGTKNLKLCYTKKHGGQDTFWEGTVEVAERRPADLSIFPPTITNLNYQGQVEGTTLEVTTSVTNNDTEPFDDLLTFWLLEVVEEDGGYVGYYVDYREVAATIAAGETQPVTAAFENLEPGGLYCIMLEYYKPGMSAEGETDTEEVQLTNIVEIVAGTDGIRPSCSDASPIDKGDIYSLDGSKVQHPRKGIYIINGKKVVIK